MLAAVMEGRQPLMSAVPVARYELGGHARVEVGVEFAGQLDRVDLGGRGAADLGGGG